MPRKADLIEQIRKMGGTCDESMLNSKLIEVRDELLREQDEQAQVVGDVRWWFERLELVQMVAIDPGDVHVGVAGFGREGCKWAVEMTPAQCLVYVREALLAAELVVVVIEEFRLYSWMAEKQSWSDFPTAQLIGALKAAVSWFGGPWDEEGEAWGYGRTKDAIYVMQPASIKKPTMAQLQARKIKSVAKAGKAGGHAEDAELHGWHWLMKARERKRKAAK